MIASVFGLPSSAIAGLPGGAGYALLAIGMILLYRMAGVVSFAQNSIGVYGAVLCANLYAYNRVPLWAALIVGLIFSGLIGALLGIAMARWFASRSVLIRSAVTIAVAVCLTTGADRVFGPNAPPFSPLLPKPNFEVLKTYLPGNTILAVGLAVALAAGIWILLRTTRLGIWLRAMAERGGTAQLLAVRVTRLTIAVWAISGIFAALALDLIGATSATDPSDLATASIEALAAVLVAGFTRLGVAVIAALVIGIFESMALATPSVAQYQQLVPLVAIVLVLVWSKRKEVWGEAR